MRSLYKIYKSVTLESQPFIIESPFTSAALCKVECVNNYEEEESTDTEEKVDPLEVYRAEGEAIIKQAQLEAEQLVSQKKQELELLAEQVRQEAHHEGYQLGYDEGQKAGYESGLNQASLEMEQERLAASKKVQDMLTLGIQECRTMMVEAEQEVIELALEIARKIIASEIKQSPEVILAIAREALLKVKDQDEVTIRVNPDDYDKMLQARHDLQHQVGRDKPILIAADEAMPKGSCCIDTSCGSVDAKVDSSYENIKKALMEVAPL